MVRSVVRQVDAIVSIRAHTIEQLLAWTALHHVPTYVLANAIHLDRYGTGSPCERLRRKYRLTGKRVLTTLARLDNPRFGTDEILEVMPELIREIPELCYLVIGGGTEQPRLEEKARRLGVQDSALRLVSETSVERIIETARREQPRVMVLDSIQTLYTESLQSAPGSVAQVRESAAQLVRFAKQSGTAMFLVGHVTKEGALAGPRVLEHMVDTVLYFEGDPGERFRMLRAVKNRFGAVNELGVFAMTGAGLKEVRNPSAIFLSRHETEVPGSVVMVTWEGTRPLLVEVQALVDQSQLSNPRRVTLGLEQNRLSMLLAVLHRHGGLVTGDKDVFVNVVGGVRVTETAADLAVLLAVMSSFRKFVAHPPLLRSIVLINARAVELPAMFPSFASNWKCHAVPTSAAPIACS